MMKFNCPHCGERSEDEFTWGGPFPVTRPVCNENPAEEVTDAEWMTYLYMRDNVKGYSLERWEHTHGCGEWLIIERSSINHEIRKVITFYQAVEFIKSAQEDDND